MICGPLLFEGGSAAAAPQNVTHSNNEKGWCALGGPLCVVAHLWDAGRLSNTWGWRAACPRSHTHGGLQAARTPRKMPIYMGEHIPGCGLKPAFQRHRSHLNPSSFDAARLINVRPAHFVDAGFCRGPVVFLNVWSWVCSCCAPQNNQHEL